MRQEKRIVFSIVRAEMFGLFYWKTEKRMGMNGREKRWNVSIGMIVGTVVAVFVTMEMY